MMALLVFLFSILSIANLSSALTCQTNFTQFPNKKFSACIQLPQSTATFSWAWNNKTRFLNAVYTQNPQQTGGWTAWGINLNNTVTMVYSSAIACFPDASGTATTVEYLLTDKTVVGVKPNAGTLNITSKSCVIDSSVSPPVYYLYFKLFLGKKPKVYQVYGAGPSVDTSSYALGQHSAYTNIANFIDLRNTTFSFAGQATLDFHLTVKNVHGSLSAVGWGFLLPLGAIIARYVKLCSDPLWFYAHVSCQISGYVIGVVGFAEAIRLWKWSSQIDNRHATIGVIIFVLATIQIFFALLRPHRDSAIRIYWAAPHYFIGGLVIVLGITNVYFGFSVYTDVYYGSWHEIYTIAIIILGAIALFLEVVAWFNYIFPPPPPKNIAEEEKPVKATEEEEKPQNEEEPAKPTEEEGKPITDSV